MRRSPLLGALTALSLGFALTACGGGTDDSPEDIRAELSEQLQDEVGLDEEQADCFAGVLVEEIGAEELADVDFSAEEPPEELQDEFTAAATSAIETCEIDAEALGG